MKSFAASFSTATFRRGSVAISAVAVTASLCSPARTYVNVLYRLPPQHTIPTHSPSGEEVDSDLFLRQLKNFYTILGSTRLVDQLHEMKACPYYECMFTAEVFFQHDNLILPMPKYGRENRSSEMSETIRYMRACGAAADVAHILQDTEGGRADGNDFISTLSGVLMGWGTARTNKLSMLAVTGGDEERSKEETLLSNYKPIQLDEDAPPLADMAAFAGQRTLIVKENPHGEHVAQQVVEVMPRVNWQVVPVEPECTFLSHACGVNYVYDVLVDQDFPQSMDRLGECGLNPFPVDWSELRKLGISMHSVCLITRFAHGSMSGGGYGDNAYHTHTNTRNYNSTNMTKNSRLFANGHRIFGDSGAPLFAQMRDNGLGEGVYQAPPRYQAPMHRRGNLVVSDREEQQQQQQRNRQP